MNEIQHLKIVSGRAWRFLKNDKKKIISFQNKYT